MQIRQVRILLAFCIVPVLSGVPVSEPAIARIPRVGRMPRLADFLPGGTREAELKISEFRQRQPADGAPASLETAAYLSYDDHAFYVVFVCRDDPGKVRARMSRRESIAGDDMVGIAIDTFHDRRHAYMFYANPLGVQLDGITTEGQPDDYKFDTIWSAEGRVTAEGYVVRMAIPFSSVRYSPAAAGTWGIALTRSIPRNNEYSTWPRITDRVEAYVPQFAEVEAPSNLPRERNIQLTPYGFASAQQFLADGPPYLRKQTELRGGLDARMILADKLTLDATVNPDFSQVESDEPQVTVNRRYEAYFPEKRPFFLENASYFQTPEMLFFSRRIVAPEFGTRLSGRVGSWGLGLLVADDRAPQTLGSADRATIGVARIQRDIGRESSVGALFTARRVGGVMEQVGAADFRWKATSNWVLTGQAFRSILAGDNGDRHSGNGLYAELRHVGRHLQNYTTYRDRSPDLQVTLGFLPRVDIRQLDNETSYRWRPEAGSLTSFGPSVHALATYDHAGRLQDWSVRVPFWLTFRGPTSVYAARTEAFENYLGVPIRETANEFYLSSDRLKWLGVTAWFSFGTGINYYPAPGLRPAPVGTTEGSFELTLRPAARLRIDETYYYTHAGAGGHAVFTNHLARSKVNYQFNRRLSARLILDYDSTLPDERRVRLTKEKRLMTEVLVTYMIQPGTAIYAGYGNSRENLQFPGSLTSAPLRAGAPSFETGRQLFVKLSYTFRP